ncbi:uncharacterized protein LOC114271251 [Camellia sinensis]|uniref:uncharacterized protein LOC114271251 n=1 Tax=Camellia sinensis TaxID=4442 RepID=UPI001036431B|nr:uncharacterized protein LOC114271251 [Camellia sinensis]
MDKSWIALGSTVDGRISRAYNDGCVNVVRQNFQIVQIHLLQHGIIPTYIIWHVHGEPRESNEAYHHDIPVEGNEDLGGIDALVEDRIRGELTNTTQEEEVRTFDKLLNDAKREVYPGCTNYTLLKFVIEILNMKVTNHWSNKSVDMMLEFLTKLLPKDNLVPKSTYEAKKILRELGLSYELIDACVNDCVLFWKGNATLDKCPNCKASRYKTNHGRGKKISRKVLRYFPLTPRLKRLYMSRKRAEDMKWFKEKHLDDGVLRHLTDSDEWKEFDTQHPEFALEPRNVRLGLATDGFNPFGNMNNSYSLWPVVLIPYNLPPWLAMKDPFFMLSLLIPGESQPGIDIDVYMRPLVEELNELWKNGTLTYDASTEVRLRIVTIDVTCLMTIQKGERVEHIMASMKKRKRSLVIPIEKIEGQLGSVTGVTYGKHPSNRKRPRQNPNWTKVSILYELPYWKKRRLRHNIDVMHVEKNFSENVFGTMLGIDGKNKDTDKARMDLEDMNIRKELWLTTNPDGSYVKPRASFSLTPKEREGFFEFLKSVKYPDGYAANISRSVNAKNSRLTGLKSHDCHVFIQRILPIGMRGYVDKEISTTLFELGSFFQDLCSRTLKRSEMEKLEECIVLILCKFEKIFPSAFFDVMVHLAIHLPCETILGGHVQYRWMYPIERFLRALKKFVTNRARPEGSIAEAYIVNECITFCSMEHKNLLQIPTGQDITQIQHKEFPKWFKEYINRLRVDEAPEATEELWSLANGPNFLVKEYSGCIINGYNTGNTGRSRTVRADAYCTSIDVTSRWYQSDPFILPSQAKLVFYLNDTKWGQPWQVVQRVQHKGVFDVPEVGDGEPPDQLEFNDAFQQENINSVVPINIEDIIRFHRDDIEVEVISNNTKRDGRDDEEDEELGILDDDMDPDMEPDMDYNM